MANNVTVKRPRLEYAENPVGIDVVSPRFSWILESKKRGARQEGYRIIVSSSRESLNKNEGDVWDSGRTASDQSVNVSYAGPSLKSGKQYFWKVKVWTTDGEESDYSETARFSMGLLDEKDWEAPWITCDGGMIGAGLMLRQDFSVARPLKRAYAYISGLGYYELRLNGKKIGDHVLDPGWTEYAKTVLYVTYDVTDYLNQGANGVGIMLGNGWHGVPKLRFQINVEYDDGGTDVISTGEWRWNFARSPIIENSVYDGEVYDARLEKEGWDKPGFKENPYEWIHARYATPPGGVLRAQMVEPIKVVDTIEPVAITQPKPGMYVVDVGQNIAGWCKLSVQAQAGTEITLKFAEMLYEDGTINQENLRTSKARNIYIAKGEGVEEYEPRFTYFGFRYVEVTGFPGELTKKNIKGRVVRSAVDVVGRFSCSNDLLNKIHDMVVWTEADNLHSVPTDCPQRNERMGWLNDMSVRLDEACYNFDLARFYTKWLQDIRDAQDKETGAVPDTAPFRWGSPDGDPVDCYLFTVWSVYLYYGDKRILEEHYEGIKQWVDFLKDRSDGYIVNYTHYGDWCTPVEFCAAADATELPPDNNGAAVLAGSYPVITPGQLISTAYLYYNSFLLSKIAGVIGKNDDRAVYAEQAEAVKQALNDRWFDEASAQYATGSQGSNAMPLFLDLVPEEKRSALVKNIENDIMEKRDGHLNTGNQCTKYMFEGLTNNGRGDTAFTMATKTTYPSWGFMLERGATTVWERWEEMTGPGMNSRNHPMHGSVDAWFFKHVAGIQPDPNNPGWKAVRIKPYPVGDLTWAEASVATVRGEAAVKWEQNGGQFRLEATVPPNATATVSIPLHQGAQSADGPSATRGAQAVTIEESQGTVWKNGSFQSGVAGIESGKAEQEYITFTVGSGNYTFTMQ